MFIPHLCSLWSTWGQNILVIKQNVNKVLKEVLSESSLNFLNSYEPDLNTAGKSLAHAESVTGRLLLRQNNYMISNQT